MSKFATICFAKTPGYTPAKTRLALNIGQVESDKLYILLVQRCRELMLQLSDFKTFIAINESEAVNSPYWQDLNIYVQAQGGLGNKLQNAESFFFQNFDQIIFWGTDSPALTTEHFHNMKATLAKYNKAIIPAMDGGFALYGANSKLMQGSWEKIHYSTSSTCQELESFSGQDVFLYPKLSDLDTYSDIQSVIAQMNEYESQGPAWDELKTFLKKI